MITAETLRNIPYLQGLEPAELHRWAERCREQRYAQGDEVIAEGDDCPGLFIVVQGRVKILKTSPEGREQILRVMGPGETFNDVPAFDGGPNPATVEAMEPSTVALIPSQVVEQLIHQHPQIAWQMLRTFAGRLRVFVDLVADLSLLNVESRIAKLLVISSENTDRAELHITQQDMAAMVGTTREVAARAIRTLEERGAIQRLTGRIQIRDAQLLARIGEGLVR